MSSSPNLPQIFHDGLIQGLKNAVIILWNAIKPYAIPAIAGAISLAIITAIACYIVRFFSQVEGDSKRKTKSRIKHTKNTIDLFSHMFDFINLKNGK